MPALLIIDGRQRLTSLYTIITGSKIAREDYTEARIRIAFRFTHGESVAVSINQSRCR